MPQDFQEEIFERLTGAEDEAEDLDSAAREHEAPNGLRHALSLSMSKVADGLIDPKLVLSWLATTLGAPPVIVGLLVPIREAGALLPQLFTVNLIRAMPRRKWAWAGGSVVQGSAAAVIVLVAAVLDGAVAGALIAAALAVLALARSVCSVSYKDILGKTVGKSRRGAITGTASSAASLAVVAFALLLMMGAVDRLALVLSAIALAAVFWVGAGLIFGTLRETARQASTGQGVPWEHFRHLREDPQLVHFIAVRGMLVSTALAPPFLVVLGGAGGAAFERLGALVLASAAASFVSSYVWGRLSDRSSRWVLILSGLSGAAALGAALALQALGLVQAVWAIPAVLFVLMIAYHGVRQGRSTYLVDMAPREHRSAYTAVSNTVIGLILLGSGVIGALASVAGTAAAVALFAVMALVGGIAAFGLNEVEVLESS
ncbi:MFS transporter [Anianabacter salinae]|uniref:MFS transporter n=1 Tax=Anianabacter salinae TaxID=2851023 RepID=UPI00225E6041|nr:MFS transporter [Anianabacter salinae]MBV0912569.1 MFS transporter [Anianabacter salinae]